MKVGILIDRLNIGGVEKIAIEQVKSFREIGINAVLVIMSRKAVVKDAFKDLLTKDVPIEYLEDKLPAFLKFSFKIPFFSFFSFFHITYPFLLPFVISNKNYSSLVSQNTYTSFLAITLSKFRKIPYSVFIYDPIAYIIKKAYPTGPINYFQPILSIVANYLDKLIINTAKKVFVNGDLHFAHLKKIIKIKQNLILLPLGHDFLKELPKTRGGCILTITAWKNGKNLETLINILNTMPNANLVVAGQWIHEDYRKKINFLIEEYNLAERVKIVGMVSEKELNEYYQKARVTVIINDERGFGMPAMEGSANGSTFIIPKECGVARYFEDKKDGFYFNYGDDKELEKYIKILINNEKLAYEMGKSAWQKVKEQYSWKQHVEKIKKELSL